MEMFQQLFVIFVVLGGLCALVWWLKRKGLAYSRVPFARRASANRGPRLEVIDRLALTPHHSLHLVKLADRTLLIGLSPNGCNLLETGKGEATLGQEL
ncbi:MAG TPA: flagellar biosynthetic protein FliO [Bryobacteraceae bacterium]|nr:flagellar biosynthetic protein FliO [Bryobacteraceae bacterium]